MIKKLRKKFIVVTMCSVIAVLFLIVGVINAVNYANVVKDVDYVVTLLKNGGGTFDFIDGNTNGAMHPNEGNGNLQPLPTPETQFETRFFTVVIGNDGDVKHVDTSKIAAVNRQQAMQYATTLHNADKSKGFCDNYRYGTVETINGTMYVFVDCTKELSNFKTFLLVSVVVGFFALVAVFVLVSLLSKRIMKPIAESYAKQKRFITDAGHEIKTPLTVMGADVEILKMQGVDSEWVDEIEQQIKRLTSLTEKLVFLARMDEESQTLRATDFSISDAVEETVKQFYAVAALKNLELDCDVQKNLSYCGDEVMIRQLVSLLVDNALKYSDENGKISLRLKSVGGKIQIVVDNPAKDLNGDLSILFERFYRNDCSRNSETGGHGIGLSIVQAIVSAHKGTVTARAENGVVTFTVTL